MALPFTVGRQEPREFPGRGAEGGSGCAGHVSGRVACDRRRYARSASKAAGGKAFPEAVREWLAVAAVKWADKTLDAAERALLRLPLASKPINAITTADVLASLMPLPDRQRQDVRQNLARVLKFASGREWVEFGKAGNPAVFEDDREELWPKFEKSNDHHARVARDDMPTLYASIVDGDTARALRFLISTAARAGDVEGATWSEIHRKGATFTTASGDTEKLVCDAWIIPAERTKERQRRHRAVAVEGHGDTWRTRRR